MVPSLSLLPLSFPFQFPRAFAWHYTGFYRTAEKTQVKKRKDAGNFQINTDCSGVFDVRAPAAARMPASWRRARQNWPQGRRCSHARVLPVQATSRRSQRRCSGGVAFDAAMHGADLFANS